jgi:hypothetical protein
VAKTLPANQLPASTFKGSNESIRMGAKQRFAEKHPQIVRKTHFSDPEGNTVEVYLDTPYYVAQPHGDALDLEKADAEIWRETEAICRADPTFMSREAWQRQFESGRR